MTDQSLPENAGDWFKVVTACTVAQEKGNEIDDATARVIASLYHDGQGSLSYRLASTGGYDNCTTVWREMFTAYSTMTFDERLVADMMGTYLANRSDTGPVEGWSKLWV